MTYNANLCSNTAMISEKHWIIAAVMITFAAILLAIVITYIDGNYLMPNKYTHNPDMRLPTNVHELETLEPEAREAQPVDQTRDVE